MKIKVSAATPKQLDWMVCRALHPVADMSATHVWLDTGDGEDDFPIEKYSTDPAVANPIIDRESICLDICLDKPEMSCQWIADKRSGMGRLCRQYGATILIATMRCYVASKSGDIVEIPDELLD